MLHSHEPSKGHEEAKLRYKHLVEKGPVEDKAEIETATCER